MRKNRQYRFQWRATQGLILTALLALAGCNSIMRQDGDSFDVNGHAATAFETDARDCTQTAGTGEVMDVRLVGDTRYAHIRRYNALFSACMTGKGYRPRPYWKNWLPR